MGSKRQKQVAAVIQRNFSILLQQEGIFIYGQGPFVTVTIVTMSPDFSLARIYVSVYNVEDKPTVILELRENITRLRQLLAERIRRHVRRIPNIEIYLDDTLDEIDRVEALFKKVEKQDKNNNPTDSITKD